VNKPIKGLTWSDCVYLSHSTLTHSINTYPDIDDVMYQTNELDFHVLDIAPFENW